ncbi:MAG: N-acetylmuramoyl-L-alanine amidase [Pseudomonadota bacterium]
MNITDFPSPNFGPRRGVAAPDMIVVHYTGMASAALALARLCSPAAEVSAHYLIDEQGAAFRLVTEARRAWHAGAAAWGAATDVNSHSIGIELAHPGHEAGNPAFPEPQMAALEALIGEIRLRWSVPRERVLGHADVAVGRKIDPGERFDWARLAAKGLAVASQAEAADAPPGDPAQVCAEAAARIGYVWQDEAALIRALQMRLCPEETGAAPSARLAARAADLAARFPVSEGRPGGPELPDGSASLDD